MNRRSRGLCALLIPVLLYWAGCLTLFFRRPGGLFLMLGWNVFLAALPLLFIRRALGCLEQGGKRGKAAVWSALWLLFFPNSVYMITDLVHLSNDRMIWFEAPEPYAMAVNNGIMHTTDLFAWTKLLLIGVGVLYGVLLGLESLRLVYEGVLRRRGLFWAAGCVCAVSALSGFGVYIGRFLRFNSWDVLRPFSLLRGVLSSLDLFAARFTLAFAGFILMAFLFYLLLARCIFAEREMVP